jgi:hypothetical protein
MNARLRHAPPIRKPIFSFFHPNVNDWVIGQGLSQTIDREVWRPAVFLEEEFICGDLAVIHVPHSKLQETNYKLLDYCRIISVTGIVCLPLAATIYDFNSLDKIVRRIASFIGGKTVPPITPIAPSSIFAIEPNGMEVGLI